LGEETFPDLLANSARTFSGFGVGVGRGGFLPEIAGATAALPAGVTAAEGLAVELGRGYWASAQRIQIG
jgi:hypothetical protein